MGDEEVQIRVQPDNELDTSAINTHRQRASTPCAPYTIREFVSFIAVPRRESTDK